MSRGVNRNDGYLEAMVKNIPSEVFGGYLAIGGLLSAKDIPDWAWWVIWAIFLIATPFYLWFANPERQARPWWQVWIFAPISFLIWSMTVVGPWGGINNAAFIGSILIILFSGVIFPLVSMGITKLSG